MQLPTDSPAADATDGTPTTKRTASTSPPTIVRTRIVMGSLFLGELDEDEDDETDQGERLGEGDAQEHRGADHARGLGLAGHGGDRVAHDDADADTGSDGGETV